MWININGKQYVRLEDVVEAITNALDGLSPKQKAKPSSEPKQVEGQLPLPMATGSVEQTIVPVSSKAVLHAVDSHSLLHDLLYEAYQQDWTGGPNIYALIDERRNAFKLVAPQRVIDKIRDEYRAAFKDCILRFFKPSNLTVEHVLVQATETLAPNPCELPEGFEPRNGKKLPRDEYMAERERVYQAIVSRVGVGVKLSRKEIASIAGVGYDVARIHIRSLIVAGRINKDDIIAIARPTKK